MSEQLNKQPNEQINDYLSVRDYGEKYNKSVWVVQWLCRNNKLTSRSIGNIWIVKDVPPPEDRKSGRPKKIT